MHLGWAYDGVNDTVPRNTGQECVEFLTPIRRILESIVIIPLCLLALKWSISRLKPFNSNNATVNSSLNNHTSHNHQRNYHQYEEHRELQRPEDNGNHQQHNHTLGKCPEYVAPSLGKQALLVVMSFTLGVEVGFKFATRTVIYILNPCHITTLIQIYLLASNKPSKTITILFRIQMNYLNGPVLAFVFPETDSRQLPLEAAVYWIQHALMCIIPIYLLRIGGVYNMEYIGDFSWNIISYAFLIIYHFGVLQTVALPSHINLNHMLCPALKDPFEGPHYRLFAFVHEALLCTLLCKLVQIVFTPTSFSRSSTSTSSSLLADDMNKNGSNDATNASSPSNVFNDENNVIIKTSKID